MLQAAGERRGLKNKTIGAPKVALLKVELRA
jgi:hypothetical protein